jgi:23S rRNA (guanosine2251-2'-O)-methyltransferase
MYNHRMPAAAYQIRLCTSCGLRYPLTDGQAFGTRCPICMGATRLVLSRELIDEPTHIRPESLPASDSQQLAVLLDNIRSAWNVGSIFRSADGFGFNHAYLCGITAAPDGPAREALAKTALGAEYSVPWSSHKDSVKLVNGLKKEGWKVWALEEHKRAKTLFQTPSEYAQKIVLMVGSEQTGLDPELLELSDEIFHIPMRGEKKSFNVAIAFGIAAFQLQK